MPTTVSFPTCKRCFLINRDPPFRRNPNSKPKPSRWFRPSTQCSAERDSGGPSSPSFSHFTEKISCHFQEKAVIRDVSLVDDPPDLGIPPNRGPLPVRRALYLSGETLTLNLTLAFVPAIDARLGRRGFGGSELTKGAAVGGAGAEVVRSVPCLLIVGGDDGGVGGPQESRGRDGGEGDGGGGGDGANVQRGGEFPKIPSMPISPEVAYSILRSLRASNAPPLERIGIISSVNVDCGKFDQVFNLG
ncbi:hypothetical protein CK203_115883 [Vitis vinifera]|uniref:Uncharacterized protein n=1 Tax=Vitis vinifera TaxID=29760 RepID=A0A438BP42_VITVI|nr:hypothetical protein CK203_115883 [Vitis vinifera]